MIYVMRPRWHENAGRQRLNPDEPLVACPSALSRACHGARSAEGLVLAVLAMLAPKWALRVAPGGSDWSALRGPIPSPPLRAVSLSLSGRDGKAGASTELES
jgi:hypothetical protein